MEMYESELFLKSGTVEVSFFSDKEGDVLRMKPFTRKVLTIIKNIPKGKVMTYGQIARHAGSPRGARQVVRVLHSMSEKYCLPWYRVVNSKGEISIKDYELNYEQKLKLENEGIKIMLNNGRIDLEKYLYQPEKENRLIDE
jgi:methylated-DNA-protein-cysteine methyltransferase-like protein